MGLWTHGCAFGSGKNNFYMQVFIQYYCTIVLLQLSIIFSKINSNMHMHMHMYCNSKLITVS